MLAIIQSRYNSLRLPGKALLRLGSKEILARCANRVSSANLVSDVLVATSNRKTDQPIVGFCKQEGLSTHLGSLNDVGTRLLTAAEAKKSSSFVRICGDSPFIDPEVIDTAISLYTSSEFDLVTNVFPRSFPKGQSVEIINTKTLQKACEQLRTMDEMEHATSFFYNHPNDFKICSFTSGKDTKNSRQCIDDKNDLAIAQKISSNEHVFNFGWQEIEKLWKKEEQNLGKN
jgi:spore coat polysaccharide biosynthesis protein SpsF